MTRASAEDRMRLLSDRVRQLEDERRRVFEDAQREADAVFAQYQLSQLLAAGGSVGEIAAAVLAEVARAAAASRAALWLARPGDRSLDLVAVFPDSADSAGATPPTAFPDTAAARAWETSSGWSAVVLPEGRPLAGSAGAGPGGGAGSSPAGATGAPVGSIGAAGGPGPVGRDPGGPGAVGFLAVRGASGAALDPDHARYLASIRHELAVTLRAAQLRASLAREQATLAAILEGATDAIVAVDAGRRVVRLNASAATLVGTPGRVGTGMRCMDFLGCRRTVPAESGPELLCGTACPFAEVLETGSPIVGREITVGHRDGSRIPVAASVSRMPTPDGGAVAILRDLRAARSLDEAKASFVAAVSHELRTPLALIDGYTQSLLHLDLDAPTARRHLERIADAAQRLAGLVDDIIDVGQVESDALVLRRTPVDLDGLLQSYVAERAETPGSRPVGLVVPRSLPRVDVDATRIRQVVANLVQNAEKHAGPWARIEIRARRLDRATVVVTVADGGRGIAPEDRDRVFERFYRGSRVRESRVPGSGLGLYLCRRIVEAHGGWIRLDATTRGTSISFGLPVAPASVASAAARGEARGGEVVP